MKREVMMPVTMLTGFTSDMIEQQERTGQRHMIESIQLPAKINGWGSKSAKEVYEDMGIRVIETTNGDPMFLDVNLPEGWKKERTDHPMWSNLLDHKGRKRGSIFYKAAFYDRDAFFNIEKRFYIFTEDYLPSDSPLYSLHFGERMNQTPIVTIIRDCDVEVFHTEAEYYTALYDKDQHYEWWAGYEDLKKAQMQKAIDHLTANFPDYQNANAYWD